jgi:outer membrane lipoprotein-sorting protein
MNYNGFLKITVFAWLGLYTTVAAMDVQQIIENMEAAEKIPYSVSVSKQTVQTPGGNSRTFTIKGYSIDNGEKSLSVYQEPARIKGEKILSLDDGNDIWTFSPKTNRVRHMATHMKKQKVMGSDFSYEDMGGGDMQKKYTITLLQQYTENDTAFYTLQMIPTEHGPSYKKVICHTNGTTWLVKKMEFYDENGLLKELVIEESRMVQGRLIPWKMVMKNKQEGGQTIVETLEMSFDVKPEEWMFTQEGLKRR